MCISTAQARRNWWAGVSAFFNCALIAVPCIFSDLVVTFRGRGGNSESRSLAAFWHLDVVVEVLLLGTAARRES